MSIAQQIASKRANLALFVTGSAQAVLAEPMTEEERSMVALDLLKLMVASGLRAHAGPMIVVTPEQPGSDHRGVGSLRSHRPEREGLEA